MGRTRALAQPPGGHSHGLCRSATSQRSLDSPQSSTRLRALQKGVVYIRCYGTVEIPADSGRGCRQAGETDELLDTGLSGASLLDRSLVRGMGGLEFADASEEGLRRLH